MDREDSLTYFLDVYTVGTSRAAIKGRNQQHLLQLSKLDFLLILQLKLPFVDRIHPQSNNFVASMKNKATGESKLDDSPGKQY